MRGTDCGSTSSVYSSPKRPVHATSCAVCGCLAKRVYVAPSMPKPFTPHYNHSVGQYVTSMAEFNSALSKGSDEASEAVGMEHKFVAVDPQEATGVGDDAKEISREKAAPKKKIYT